MLNNLLTKANQNKKKIILHLVTLLVSFALLIVGNKLTFDKETMFLGGYDDGASSATVTNIVSSDVEKHYIDGQYIGDDVYIIFECEITSGDRDGEIVTAVESFTVHDTVKLKEVQEGDRVFIIEAVDGEDDKYDWYLFEYDRTVPLWVLGLIFVVLILLFGRKKGINTLISLSFTCAAVFLVFVPSVLSEKNIYFWAIITCIYIIIMSLTINEGYNKKTLAAIIGCSCGVIVAGVLTLTCSHFLKMSGITGDDSINLKMNLDIDLNALIFAGIILGAVGAVKDVAVSISSSLKEIHEQVEKPTFSGLVKSGMNIGRDVMGTMADTLVLAYIGCELSATLIQIMYSSSLTTLLSREKIVAELLQALVGSIGILMTIPLTAVVSAMLYTGFKGRKKYDKYYIEPTNEPSLFEKTENTENVND